MKDKILAALKRAAWTTMEVALATFITLIPEGVGIDTIDWKNVLSIVALTVIISFAKSILVGMPEVSNPVSVQEVSDNGDSDETG